MERLLVVGSILIVIMIPILSRVIHDHESLTVSAFLLFGVSCGSIGVGIGKLSCKSDLEELRRFRDALKK